MVRYSVLIKTRQDVSRGAVAQACESTTCSVFVNVAIRFPFEEMKLKKETVLQKISFTHFSTNSPDIDVDDWRNSTPSFCQPARKNEKSFEYTYDNVFASLFMYIYCIYNVKYVTITLQRS